MSVRAACAQILCASAGSIRGAITAMLSASPDYAVAGVRQTLLVVMSVFRAAEVPFRSIKAHRPYPRLLFRVVRASSGPEVGHGRTPTDVLSNPLEELLMGPTAAEPHHDAAATDHHRRGHLDQE